RPDRHRLEEPRPVPQEEEVDGPAAAEVVHPPADLDLPPEVIADPVDRDDRHRCSRVVAAATRATVRSTICMLLVVIRFGVPAGGNIVRHRLRRILRHLLSAACGGPRAERTMPLWLRRRGWR